MKHLVKVFLVGFKRKLNRFLTQKGGGRKGLPMATSHDSYMEPPTFTGKCIVVFGEEWGEWAIVSMLCLWASMWHLVGHCGSRTYEINRDSSGPEDFFLSSYEWMGMKNRMCLPMERWFTRGAALHTCVRMPCVCGKGWFREDGIDTYMNLSISAFWLILWIVPILPVEVQSPEGS